MIMKSPTVMVDSEQCHALGTSGNCPLFTKVDSAQCHGTLATCGVNLLVCTDNEDVFQYADDG